MIKMFIDHKALLRGIAGVSSAIVALLIAQQLINEKHNEARAWTNDAKAEIISRENERYALFDSRLGRMEKDQDLMKGWLWELVKAKRNEGSATPEKNSLNQEGGRNGR